MSFAKLCSLLERRELFFSLVGAMEDTYEGFICPPPRNGYLPDREVLSGGGPVSVKVPRVRNRSGEGWADGVYLNVRLEDAKQCVLVVIGVDEHGFKHFLAIEDGYRFSRAGTAIVSAIDRRPPFGSTLVAFTVP